MQLFTLLFIIFFFFVEVLKAVDMLNSHNLGNSNLETESIVQIFDDISLEIVWCECVCLCQNLFRILEFLATHLQHFVCSGPREDVTRIGSAGVVRSQVFDISPLRRVNQVLHLLTTGARESAFSNIKTLADELINAAKGEKPDCCTYILQLYW